ncbi:hypothetical protein [Paludibacterium denitrificans]|nr:hypothetical protein [Paludibacterium denitrificans]
MLDARERHSLPASVLAQFDDIGHFRVMGDTMTLLREQGTTR